MTKFEDVLIRGKSESVQGISKHKVEVVQSAWRFVLEKIMYSTLTRSLLVASMVAAFSRIEKGVVGSVREVLLLANILPEQQPTIGMVRRASPRSTHSGKKRRGGPRKLHARDKRKRKT